ncbi:hypothetical protein Bca52824_084038 [Brassica carinata]|uniref:SUN domain-containing protein n=1 Tax=Brassica carinata TaxID=52824 RepID=A0A8X7PNL1_BRACI|nr:hypothetical protein Bca52824_084038 [Brassica carinata]
MQRSRRALLIRTRRASESASNGRNRLYKVSLSLVFLIWGLLLLSTLWISHGNGDQVDPDAVSANETAEHVDAPPLDSTFVHSTLDIPSAEKIKDVHILSKQVEVNNTVTGNLTESKGSDTVKQSEMISNNSGPVNDKETGRPVPFGLDEFKSRVSSSKDKSLSSQVSGVTHRMEPGGKEYNYAAASKGAKVLSSNKEAKGATSIITGTKTIRCLRTFRRTLVNTIKIANFEHYSSNLKDFEILGTLVYPTDAWVHLGNFTALNMKNEQNFTLGDPQWVRYLKLSFLSHYGSEFYCTLSLLEVYGVDAVERMLEDLISIQDKNIVRPQEEQKEKKESDDDMSKQKEKEEETSPESAVEVSNERKKLPDLVEEIKHHQPGSRMPGDTVLKILMQKIRSLDLSLSVLESYLDEMSSRYGKIFKEMDQEASKREEEVAKMWLEVDRMKESEEKIKEEAMEMREWRSRVEIEIENSEKEKEKLKERLELVLERMEWMEKKGVAVFTICVGFGAIAVVAVLLGKGIGRAEMTGSLAWLMLLISSTFVMFVLSL